MNFIGHSRYKDPEKHKYVALIEFVINNDTFSASDAIRAIGLTAKEFSFISNSIFKLSGSQDGSALDYNKVHTWILNPEAYFSYLQFLEFQHSIEHANRAYWLSVLAIMISILGVGFF